MRTPPPLRSRGFRALWLAGLISNTGDWLLLIALPVVVYEVTGSALGTSIAFLVELLPGIVLAPLAGWSADRWDRRRVLVVTSLAQAVALLPLVAVHTRAGLPILYAVMLAEASLLTLFDPAKNALLADLVPAPDRLAANSLVGLGQNVARLVGGPLGGVVLAVGGLRLVLVVDLLSYLAAAVFIGRLPAGPAARSAPRQKAGPTIRRGPFAAVLRSGRVRATLLITLVSQIAQGAFVVLFILFVEQRLHGGSAEVGLLRGVQAVGAIAGGLVLTGLARRCPAPRLIAGSALAFGLLDLLVWNGPAVTTAAAFYVVLFVLIGAPGIVFGTALITTLQTEAPAHQHGRVFSAAGFASNTGQVIGMLVAGLLEGRIGLLGLLNAQAGLYLATGTLAAVLAAADSGRRQPISARNASCVARSAAATKPVGPASTGPPNRSVTTQPAA